MTRSAQYCLFLPIKVQPPLVAVKLEISSTVIVVDIDALSECKEYEISEDPQDYEYGGYWYKKGKESQKILMGFYEKFGFFEDPTIYLKWGCYDKYPYPTLRLNMNNKMVKL